MHPYRQFVSEHARLWRDGHALPLGGFAPLPRPGLAPDAPRALLFSPHPDDECLIGALPLRLLRQAGMRVINVAVTQGSNKARQAERWRELQAACEFIGFDLLPTAPNGLEKINPTTRQDDPGHWRAAVAVIAELLRAQRPAVIFFPHEHDWNSTHIGTHWLVMDALRALGGDFACFLVETEFWGAMDDPNLLVESSEDDVADLIAALTFHVGEVRRNPYHLVFPAWLQDNVRRGGELVGGQGGAPPDFCFATLYRLRRWATGRVERVLERGTFLSAGEPPAKLFASAPRPVIGRLETRDYHITIKAGPVGPVYHVATKDGQVLVNDLMLEQIKTQAPSLYDLLKSSLAGGGAAGGFLDARL
jgi:LmbE family N-acetylglucosaminyl deacetylase